MKKIREFVSLKDGEKGMKRMQFIILLLLLLVIIIAVISYSVMFASVQFFLKLIYVTKGVAVLLTCFIGVLILICVGYLIHAVIDGVCYVKELKQS